MPQSEEIRLLRDSVDNLAEKVEDERQARRQTIIVAVAALVALILSVGYGLGSNRAQIHSINDSRAEARVASCNQDNEQSARSRAGNKAQIRVTFGFLTGNRDLDQAQKDRLDELYRLHDKAIDDAFPDRDCSPEGIRKFFEEGKT